MAKRSMQGGDIEFNNTLCQNSVVEPVLSALFSTHKLGFLERPLGGAVGRPSSPSVSKAAVPLGEQLPCHVTPCFFYAAEVEELLDKRRRNPIIAKPGRPSLSAGAHLCVFTAVRTKRQLSQSSKRGKPQMRQFRLAVSIIFSLECANNDKERSLVT